MSVARTARLAIRPRASMPRERRTDLMGATRPQTPRRSPRQAFGGNSGSTPQSGKQTKTKTLTNPQNFSYEVSQLRGAGKLAPQPDHLVEKQPEALHLHCRAREAIQQRAVLLLGLEQLAQEDADHLPVPDHAAACLDRARLRRLKELETTPSGRFDDPDPVPVPTKRFGA